VREVDEYLDAFEDDVVAFVAGNVRYKSNAAGIVLIARVVEALRLGQTSRDVAVAHVKYEGVRSQESGDRSQGSGVRSQKTGVRSQKSVVFGCAGRGVLLLINLLPLIPINPCPEAFILAPDSCLLASDFCSRPALANTSPLIHKT
jgi:hypothetical protein